MGNDNNTEKAIYYFDFLRNRINKLGHEVRIRDFGKIAGLFYASIVLMIVFIIDSLITILFPVLDLSVIPHYIEMISGIASVISMLVFVIISVKNESENKKIRDIDVDIRKSIIRNYICAFLNSPMEFCVSKEKKTPFDFGKDKLSPIKKKEYILRELNCKFQTLKVTPPINTVEYLIAKFKNELKKEEDKIKFEINASLFILIVTLVAELVKSIAECIIWVVINCKSESLKNIVIKVFNFLGYAFNRQIFWEHVINQGNDFTKSFICVVASVVAIIAILVLPKIFMLAKKSIYIDPAYRIRNIEYAIAILSEIKKEYEDKEKAEQLNRENEQFEQINNKLDSFDKALKNITEECNVKDLINDQNILVGNVNDNISSIGNEVNEIKKKQRIRRQANIRKSKKS